MKYRPDEKDWMSYIYGEMEGAELERFEQFLAQSEEARQELAGYRQLRGIMGKAEDKEVIAPPIVIGDTAKNVFFWNAPYFKTILSIAASLLLIIFIGKAAGVQIRMSGNEVSMSFGTVQSDPQPEAQTMSSLSKDEVQEMINQSLVSNNGTLQAGWKDNQDKLSLSIRSSLAQNSEKIDALVRHASTASQEQVTQYIATLQNQNMQAVKDYFALSSAEQKKYVENLLVDFAAYLQQQRNNDLQLVEMKMNSLQKNTDLFKQETEQILSSIITNVNGSTPDEETKN